MRRSALVVVVTVLVGLFVGAVPAAAALNVSVLQPKHGDGVTSGNPVPVAVRVERTEPSDPAIQSVSVRLFSNGSSASQTSLTCSSGCDSFSQTWAGEFDPRPATPLRNGEWKLQTSVNEGAFQDKITIYLSLPPSPVSNLQTTAQPGGVKLSWNRAPEPDISGYRIERSTSEGAWQQVASVGPDATAYTDEAPPGEYNYRVVSRRPSGKSGEPELTAASGSKSAEVPRPSKSEDKSPGAPAPGGGTGTTTGSSAGDATQNTSRGPLAARVPPPPQARRGFGFNLRSLAQAFGQRQGEGEGDQEDYFGEGEGFSEELDYSGVDPVTGEPVDLPLGESIQRMLISQLTNRPLLISLAVGLLLLALAVYILHWVRRSPSPPDASQSSSYAEASQSPPSALSRFRSLFGAGDRPAPPAAEVPSPTTAPLSPRRSAQTRPLSRQEVGAAAERTATTTKPERRPAYPTTTSPLFDGDRQARRNPREELPRDETRRTSRDETPRAPRVEARQGGSVLFAPRESSAAPTSGRGRSGSDGSTGNVKVLRPPSADERNRPVR